MDEKPELVIIVNGQAFLIHNDDYHTISEAVDEAIYKFSLNDDVENINEIRIYKL